MKGVGFSVLGKKNNASNPNVEILNETLRILRKGHYRLGSKTVMLKLPAERQRKAVVYDAATVLAMRKKELTDPIKIS